VLRRARAALLAGAAPGESAYNLLEVAAALASEFEAAAEGGELRVLPQRSNPERARSTGEFPGPADPAALARATARTRHALEREREELAARWDYHLLRRNCITELLRLVNGSFESRSEIERALGGHLEPGEGLGFAPLAFFEQVKARLRVVGTERVVPYRERELARIFAADPGRLRRLREATVLTSSIYTPRRRDGAFLLFADGPAWSRPALGLVNLTWSLGALAPGLVAAPFDRGSRAHAAFSGALFSVPELAFLRLRKGSFEYVAGH
jgi:hypothetical protein